MSEDFKFPPTEEQQAIIDASQGSTDNLVISALAGAAKTNTLVRVSHVLKDTNILCLAFNKKIADEMVKRLPSNCVARTLNSLGHRVWADACSSKLSLDDDKMYKLVNEACKLAPVKDRSDLYDRMADLIKAVKDSKTCGYVPDGHYPTAKRLMNDEQFYNWLEDEPTGAEWRIIRQVVLKSIDQGHQGKIDFNDQILLPTIFPAPFPYFPLVLIDEAQDLSALNHATLKKLAKKRLIAVGDENQAIYGFRGAHADSMPLLRDTFNMKQLVLSISFRCPQAVVREAQWRASHMRFPDWAIEGSVKRLAEWDKDTIPVGAAIICRNNAPLFTMAIKLLKNGRYCTIVGNDIGKGLVRIMKKFGPGGMNQAEVMNAIEAWYEGKLSKTRDPGKIKDQADCMRVFAEQAPTLDEAVAVAENLLSQAGPIQLMTGHKSKGLEFETVFFLDEDLIRMDEPQDQNLKYVIQTRAKKELIYVKTADFYDHRDNAPRPVEEGTGAAVELPPVL